MSPYMAKIVGQEDYIYVWTLGAEGFGDEQDIRFRFAHQPRPAAVGESYYGLRDRKRWCGRAAYYRCSGK